MKELTIVRPASVEESQTLCDQASHLDVVFIMGGDGTVHDSINRLSGLSVRPVVGLLPGGTSNDFTRALEIPQNLKQAATALVNGHIRPMDVGQAGTRYFMNFWGVGLVTDTSQNVDEEQKKNFGPLSYIASTFRTIKEAESFSYRIVAKNEQLVGEALAIFILNGNYIATNRIPIAGISPSDGLLDVLVVKNSNLATLRELLSLRNENTTNETLSSLEYVQVRDVEIEAAHQQQVDMDGELHDFESGHICILPGHLNVLVPR